MRSRHPPLTGGRPCPAGGRSCTDRPLCVSVKCTSGWASATRENASVAWPISVCGVRRNFCRTGVLKNRLRTSTAVPTGHPAASTSPTLPPLTSSSAPASASAGRLRSVNRLTAEILASASPRNPSDPTRNKSSADAILLVAWLVTASGSCSATMPHPLSTTRISSAPPFSIATSTRVAPLSTAFSTSSFTTLAGRSITSPAAILLTTELSSGRMVGNLLSVALRLGREIGG